MLLILGPNALVRASEAEVRWHENPRDPGALSRVYGQTELIPTYEYPAFNVNEQSILVQHPEHDNARFQPFKTQFQSLGTTLLTLNQQFNTPQAGDEPNEVKINKFLAGILCGFTNDTSTKYSHQEADAFKQIKYNLEVILNSVIKNKDKKTFKDLMYTIAMCEGGVGIDFERMKRAFSEPVGRSQYLEAERGRIVGALAQQHIAKEEEKGTPIEISLQTHVEILFTRALELWGVPLPQLMIRDVHIPRLVKDEVNGVVFENNAAAISAVNSYHLSHDDLVAVKNDFLRTYADRIAESMSNHLNENLEILYKVYKNENEALKLKINDLKDKKKKLNNELSNARGEGNAGERLRIRSLLKMIESEMNSPLDKFMSELKNMMDAYGLHDFSSNFIIDYNDEGNIVLQVRDGMYYLFAAINASFEADEILSGFEKLDINDHYVLVFDGFTQWIVDKTNNPSHLHDFFNKIDDSSWGKLVSALVDEELSSFLISEMNDEALDPKKIIELKNTYYNLRYLENKNGLSAISNALNNGITYDIIWVIRWSIEHKKDLNVKDDSDETALIWAAKNGHKDIVFSLIKANANLYMTGALGVTALIWAACHGYVEIAKELIKAGGSALTRIKINEGHTALHFATDKGYSDIVKELLKTGGPELARIQTDEGITALHIAAGNDYPDIALAVLVSGGSELAKLIDESQDTPVHYAIRLGKIDTAKRILVFCGKSVAAGAPFSLTPGSTISLNDIPYKRDGYIQDENKDQLLLKDYANLEVLYRDLAREAGFGDNPLPSQDKLYLYALAFQCYAKRILSSESPHLKSVDSFIQTLKSDMTNKDEAGVQPSYGILLSVIRSTQKEIKNSTRYKFGQLFPAPVTIYENIPAIVTLTATAGLRPGPSCRK
jgi:ankyrin repeat protein